jgi:hypothetical protein
MKKLSREVRKLSRPDVEPGDVIRYDRPDDSPE